MYDTPPERFCKTGSGKKTMECEGGDAAGEVPGK